MPAHRNTRPDGNARLDCAVTTEVLHTVCDCGWDEPKHSRSSSRYPVRASSQQNRLLSGEPHGHRSYASIRPFWQWSKNCSALRLRHSRRTESDAGKLFQTAGVMTYFPVSTTRTPDIWFLAFSKMLDGILRFMPPLTAATNSDPECASSSLATSLRNKTPSDVSRNFRIPARMAGSFSTKEPRSVS